MYMGITAEQLHDAAKVVGTDDDGQELRDANIDREEIVQFCREAQFLLPDETPVDVEPRSLALGISIGVVAAARFLGS